MPLSIVSWSIGLFSNKSNDNFTSLCPNGSVWIWEGLKECAVDGRDMASVYLGLLSIVCFMFSSIPQYYRSWKSKNMDEALSIWFLLGWLGGDSCNLIGSFLADQLPLQVYTAVYYVVADLLMLALYLYFSKMRNKATQSGNSVNSVAVILLIGGSASFFLFQGNDFYPDVPSTFRGRTLLTVSADHSKEFTKKQIIGFTIGSFSSLLYLCSRIPQIYTNFKRKSTKGLSYFLIALVILGNATYGVSVLLKNPDRGQTEGDYVVHHIPWLIGSLGTLSLDLIISAQFLMYRNQTTDDEQTSSLLDKDHSSRT
ncbi:lysosomal amino acid transporter 1 homolog [Polypterus senegalus]|uniref:lysosomal amino acid transporter 1 homolog n=1 Tax=Polypterus senegalus TaxID=55291 RepID=UPI0019665CF4|nr:lysosomal amino acid transporter 1 homolog [Polypterus senegalus]XP_039611936.1 lysosomal amino acid transporter 1 homolog [Polypterus senegalus]